MIPVSQQYFDASVNSLLQSVAEMASKAAVLAGQLADANLAIAQLRAKIEELSKPAASPETPPSA